ncbi:MAG: serine/threonine-protein kinase [Desulfatiglans sp.]|jgi:serine/threonine-protein kinase|nr:serine/threonine-protein kinase [Thermodesulfobacteriota bacterium]MEE4353394.1 serine/threonine-protein kinase [Desulfatiglans sp.]
MTSIKEIKADNLIGQDVGTCTILDELARGGMGMVFIAYQRTLRRRIALKILPKSLITPTTAQFFQQEAEAAAILSHPNIIPIYEVGETDDFLFFTMQLVEGRALSDLIKKARKNIIPSKRLLPLKASLLIVIKVLEALDYAHGHDIVHRDIKPANILIENHSNRPIVMDFGVAKVSRDSSEESSLILGTPTYMAPEQISNDKVDGRADIYATATMLFEMIVPRLPCPKANTSMELLNNKLELKNRYFRRKPSELNPALIKEMDLIISKALSFDRDKRFDTCLEFSRYLKGYIKRYL